jgi:hypothetical protein
MSVGSRLILPTLHDDIDVFGIELDQSCTAPGSQRLDPLWDELFPAEQARIVQLLIERIDIRAEGVDIRLRTAGLRIMLGELAGIGARGQRAA